MRGDRRPGVACGDENWSDQSAECQCVITTISTWLLLPPVRGELITAAFSFYSLRKKPSNDLFCVLTVKCPALVEKKSLSAEGRRFQDAGPIQWLPPVPEV